MHQLNDGVHSQCILYLHSFTIMPIYKAQILSLSLIHSSDRKSFLYKTSNWVFLIHKGIEFEPYK